MSSIPRPGGRSARVQAAVHRATLDLLAQDGRAALTVPLIAARAGVTPSTIYRRWGDLAELLADIAVERLRPDDDPPDTGSVEGDLRAWVEQYRDEMSSQVGLDMMLDVLAAKRGPPAQGQMPVPCQCAAFTASRIEALLARGVARGEAVPSIDAVMDTVVSPIVYRALFGPLPATPDQAQALVDACLRGARAPAPAA